MVKNRFFGIVALLVAILGFIGCEDFESELAYDVELQKPTTYKVVGVNEDNTVKVKVMTEVIVHALVNETMDNSLIQLDDEERHADVEHVSDSVFLLSATFDRVSLRRDVTVCTTVRGIYLNDEIYSSIINIKGNDVVDVSDVQALAVGPDSVSLQIGLKNSQCMVADEAVRLTVVMEKDNEPCDDYSLSLPASDIRDGKGQAGILIHVPAGIYTVSVRNADSDFREESKSLQVNIPDPTASYSNVQYYIDEMGMHITGDINRGNLLCAPYFQVKMGDDTYRYRTTSSSFHAKKLYPLYNTPVSVVFMPQMKGGQSFGESKTFNVTSGVKRYAVDMGGDVYWSVYNEGASDGNIEGELFLRTDCEQDGYWRLPTLSEYKGWNVSVQTVTKNGIKGVEVKSSSTGNVLFFPAVKYFHGSDTYLDQGRYWLEKIYNDYYYFFNPSSKNYDDYWSGYYPKYYARYVRPKNPVRVTAINLSETSLDAYIGRTETLTATVVPEDADAKSLTYTSSNPEIATVSTTGEITPLKLGQCIITVSSVEKDVKATCTVNVVGEYCVDLGLSALWCTCNVGANANTDLGESMYGDKAKSKYNVPTKEQYQELLDNCTKEQVCVNGVEGWRFTASNGKSVFFPVTNTGYWTSSSYSSYSKWYSKYCVTVYYLSVKKDTEPEIMSYTSSRYESASDAANKAWHSALRYVRAVVW